MNVESSVRNLLADYGYTPVLTVDQRLFEAARPLFDMSVFYDFKLQCKRNEVSVTFSQGNVDITLFATLWNGAAFYSAVVDSTNRPRLTAQVPYDYQLRNVLESALNLAKYISDTRRKLCELKGMDEVEHEPETDTDMLALAMFQQLDEGSARHFKDSDETDDVDDETDVTRMTKPPKANKHRKTL